MIRKIVNSDYLQFIKLINTNVSKEEFTTFLSNMNNQHIIVIYEKDNDIIGTGTLLIESKLTYGISYLGHIENILVHENHRNCGIGKNIVEYLVDYAKNHSCYRIDLACEEKLINFYQRVGFNKKIICMSMINKENFKK
jgi:glucosamine-phosphate N-acetyltransferase